MDVRVCTFLRHNQSTYPKADLNKGQMTEEFSFRFRLEKLLDFEPKVVVVLFLIHKNSLSQ